MTFLAKLGSFLAKGIAVLTGLGPLIAPFLGSSASKAAQVEKTVVNDLTSVGQVVLQTETILQTPGSGAAKLAAATPLVVQILKTSELVSGHQIGNEALFTEGASDITSGVAKLLNSLKADNVKSQGQPVIPVTPISVTETTAQAVTSLDEMGIHATQEPGEIKVTVPPASTPL